MHAHTHTHIHIHIHIHIHTHTQDGRTATSQQPHICTFSQQIYLPKFLIHVAHSRFSPQIIVNFIVQVFLFCIKRALKFKFSNSSSKGRNHFVPRSTKALNFCYKSGLLISCRKIIDVCCENHKKHKHTHSAAV